LCLATFPLILKRVISEKKAEQDVWAMKNKIIDAVSVSKKLGVKEFPTCKTCSTT
jgi:hypothetical protein